MPEAPQVRILVEKLQPFVGKKILEATTLEKDFDASRLAGQTIKEIKVFGKQILIVLPKFAVRYHLLMFGVIKINERNPNGKLRLGLKFKDGEFNCYAGDIYYIDEPLDQVFDASTDVMDDQWSSDQALKKLLDRKDELISDLIIDQDIFNGAGNKSVNEALYRTKVHPASVVEAIPMTKLKAVVSEVREFAFDYYEWAKEGTAEKNFTVYKKKLCPEHGTPLRHEQIGKNGRKCHFCDECQKLYI